jgi:hypothetical protein
MLTLSHTGAAINDTSGDRLVAVMLDHFLDLANPVVLWLSTDTVFRRRVSGT